jgi:Uma2 family endonuclease
LIDGVIVEKAMGWEESTLGAKLIAILDRFLVNQPMAIVAGADGLSRLRPGRIRMPDVGVYLLSRFPGGKARRVSVCDIAPDWAVEILSRSNTRREMEIKRKHFFAAGTKLIWNVDPRARTVEVWTSPKVMQILTEEDTADLGDILPGFTVNIGTWFREMDAVLEAEDELESDGEDST